MARFGKSWLAVALAPVAGCASNPPPPPGPSIEEFQEVSARLEEAQVEIAELREKLGRTAAEARAAREAAAVASLETARGQVEQKRLAREMEEAASSTGPSKRKAGSAPALRGTVLATDPKMDLYLISIGKKDGVTEGVELVVYRDDTFVASVLVEKVFADKASVKVKVANGKALRRGEIQVGDRVGDTF